MTDEIEEEDFDFDGESDDNVVQVHPGAALLGIFFAIFSVITYYQENIELTYLLVICLLVLGLGSKIVNQM